MGKKIFMTCGIVTYDTNEVQIFPSTKKNSKKNSASIGNDMNLSLDTFYHVNNYGHNSNLYLYSFVYFQT